MTTRYSFCTNHNCHNRHHKKMSLEITKQSNKVKIRQYQALFEAAESIAAHRDLSSLLRDLAERLQSVVKFDGVNVVRHDPERNVMRMNVLESGAISRAQLPAELPVDESPGGWVWQTQQPMLISDLSAYESRFPPMNDLKRLGVKTVYILPLTSVDRRLGALGFASLRGEAWSEDDQELLQQVAKLVAVAVDNAINFESARATGTELKRRLDHQRLMLRVINTVVSQLDLRELLDVISASIREALGCDTVGVGLYDHESQQLRAFATQFPPGHPFREKGIEIPFEGSPGGLAFTSGQPVFLDKPDLERFNSDFIRQIYEDGYRSGGSIPLIAQGRKLGVLGVASKRENFLSDDDKELLVQVANQVAIAVDNALNF